MKLWAPRTTFLFPNIPHLTVVIRTKYTDGKHQVHLYCHSAIVKIYFCSVPAMCILPLKINNLYASYSISFNLGKVLAGFIVLFRTSHHGRYSIICGKRQLPRKSHVVPPSGSVAYCRWRRTQVLRRYTRRPPYSFFFLAPIW